MIKQLKYSFSLGRSIQTLIGIKTIQGKDKGETKPKYTRGTHSGGGMKRGKVKVLIAN